MPLLFTSLLSAGAGVVPPDPPFLWTTNLLYRFSASEAVYADLDGLIPATDMTPVARWGNLGPGSPALQSTSARRPIFRTGGLYGRPYLSCTNSLQQHFEDLPFTQPAGTSTFAPYTVFSVTSGVGDLANSPALWGSSATNGGKAAIYFRSTTGAQHHLFTSGIRIGNVVNPQILMGAWGRNAAGSTGNIAQKWVRQNRVNIFSAASQTTAPDGTALTTAQFLRCSGLGSGGFFHGQLYEFILYTGILSDADTFAIEAWLAARYGLG